MAVLIAEPGASAQEKEPVRYGQALGSRLVVQEEMGRWLSDTLTQISDPYPVLVTVDLQLRGEMREVTDKQIQPGMDMQLGVNRKLKLPGLPTVDQKLGARGMSVKVPGRESVKVTHELDTIVERITLRLFVEEDMPESKVERARTLATSLAGIEAGRGDTVEVVTVASLGRPAATAAARGGFDFWKLAVICGTLLLSFVLLAIALGARRRSATTRMVGEFSTSGANIAPAGTSDSHEAVSQTGESTDESNAKKTRAFNFLAAASTEEQIHLLSHVNAHTAAVLIHHVGIEPDVTRQLFEQLPEERQLAIAVALSEPIVIPASEIERLEQILRERLQETRANVTIGGHGVLASVLQEVRAQARDALLAQLSERDTELGEKLRDKMVLFEDIVRFPKETIRQIVTEVDPQVTALALRGAPEPIREAVFAAVSRRLRAVLEAENEGLERKSDDDGEVARRTFELAMRRSWNGVSWA